MRNGILERFVFLILASRKKNLSQRRYKKKVEKLTHPQTKTVERTPPIQRRSHQNPHDAPDRHGAGQGQGIPETRRALRQGQQRLLPRVQRRYRQALRAGRALHEQIRRSDDAEAAGLSFGGKLYSLCGGPKGGRGVGGEMEWEEENREEVALRSGGYQLFSLSPDFFFDFDDTNS